jgi:hypothetical protein
MDEFIGLMLEWIIMIIAYFGACVIIVLFVCLAVLIIMNIIWGIIKIIEITTDTGE